MINSKELRESSCEICGKHIGGGFNHSKCSKEKQRRRNEEHKTKAQKKLSKKQADNMGRWYKDR